MTPWGWLHLTLVPIDLDWRALDNWVLLSLLCLHSSILFRLNRIKLLILNRHLGID